MTRSLRISRDLSLPASVVTATTVVLGGKGMGKTNLAAVMIEEMAKAGLRWRLLDPLGVSYGLRHSADGKGKGVECIILGGAHGDIPIEPTAGAIVADFLVNEDVNVIVDFSRKASGEMWTVGEKVRFLTEVALRAFQLQGGLVDGRRRDPFCLLLDEAARYIPQVIPAGNPDLAKCVGAWEQLAEEGRNIGIGVGFLTQRSARINKSVTELADVLFAFRTFGPRSLAAIMDWLGDHVPKERLHDTAKQIRELDVGQCLVVSPGWLKHEGIVRIRPRETFDSSATPKPGERQKKVSGKAAAPDLAKYQARMAETIEKAKAADPKELQKEITRLKGDLAKAGKGKAAPAAAAPDPAVLQRRIDRAVEASTKMLRQALEAAMKFIVTINTANFDVAGVDKAELEKAVAAAVDRATKLIGDQLEARGRVVRKLKADAERLLAELEKVKGVPRNVTVDVAVTKNEPFSVGAPKPPRSPRPAVAAIVSTNGDLSAGEQRILNAMAELKAMGVLAPTRAQAGAMARYDLTGGSGSTYVGRLVSTGHLTLPGKGTLYLTAEGEAAAAPPAPMLTDEDLHERALAYLKPGEARILMRLIELYPDTTTRAALGPEVGYDLTGGSGSTYVGKLTRLGFVDLPGSGQLRASDLLFPSRA